MKSVNLDKIKKDLNVSSLDEMEYFPKYFQIKTVNACNARCVMCAIDNWSTSNAKDKVMSMELFEKFTKEVSNYSDWIEVICLNKDGEPTLDKLLPKRVKMLKEVGIKEVIFSTNAQNLSSELALELLEAELNRIMISIDGFSKEVYTEIRRGLNFDKVMKNTLNFIKQRNDINSKCQIRIRAVRMKENEFELDKWLSYWKEQLNSSDIVQIMPMHNWGGQLDEDWQKQVQYYSGRACVSPFGTFILKADGTVPLCCIDYNTKNNMGKFPEKSIKNIWNNKKFKKIRNFHENSNRNKISICQGCNTWDK